MFAVDRPVTVGAERNQILFAVVAKVAPRLDSRNDSIHQALC